MDPLIDDDVSELPPVRVTPYPDGPLVIRGDFVISDVCGNEIPSGRAVALCRCGRSARKPFCDGTHASGHSA
ncbi:MAG TPA: CDGSH iron-sulfur domain-containing protein [Jatrophihabitantaceae bacterium]|nr:CDGSH iron-sulfur domain-containing protein [Jatrophihabitantaceae bacterium]